MKTRIDRKEIGVSTSNWIDSAPDRDCWRALVIAALDLQASYVLVLVN
jgi:hypothetical protein